MKDEGRTHRLRLSPKALCFLVGILMLIPIGFATSVWLNIHLYKERSVIVKNQIMLQYEVDQNAQTIARLSNLEGFLRDHSPGLLGLLVSQSNVDTMLIPTIGNKDEKLARELRKLAMKNTNTTINTKNVDKLDPTNNIASTDNVTKTPIDGKKTITVPPITDAKTDKDLTKKDKEEIASQKIKQSIDLGYVTLQRVKANLMGNNIQIQYYLKNSGKDIPLLGEQKYTLLSMKNGKMEQTPLPNATNDNFRIRNLKIVESTVQLLGIKANTKSRIQIEIVRNGTTLFREAYPITR